MVSLIKRVQKVGKIRHFLVYLVYVWKLGSGYHKDLDLQFDLTTIHNLNPHFGIQWHRVKVQEIFFMALNTAESILYKLCNCSWARS